MAGFSHGNHLPDRFNPIRGVIEGYVVNVVIITISRGPAEGEGFELHTIATQQMPRRVRIRGSVESASFDLTFWLDLDFQRPMSKLVAGAGFRFSQSTSVGLGQNLHRNDGGEDVSPLQPPCQRGLDN